MLQEIIVLSHFIQKISEALFKLFISNGFGCVITAIAAVAASWFGAIKANDLNRDAEERKSQEFKKSVLKSLRAELQTLLDVYKPMMDQAFDCDGFTTWTFGARQDFFTIYHSNGAFIGQIENDELKEEIIKTYILTKKYLEQWMDYGNELNKYDFEKQQMLKNINFLLITPIFRYDLNELLKQESDLIGFLKGKGILDINSLNNLHKCKIFIWEMGNDLQYYNDRLKKEFDELLPQMQQCIQKIDNYLQKFPLTA